MVLYSSLPGSNTAEPFSRKIPLLSDLTLADIPSVIGLFPLYRTLLLPRGKLPLNVFEPRYIALMEEALATHRLIGIIQPLSETYEEDLEEGLKTIAALYKIGCIGRITSFNERPDGSMAITLTGIIRFRILRDRADHTLYNQAYIDSSTYGADLLDTPVFWKQKTKLFDSLRRYCHKKGYNGDWPELEQLDSLTLSVIIPMLCPFPAAEKQALLEAPTIEERMKTLQLILDVTGQMPDKDYPFGPL